MFSAGNIKIYKEEKKPKDKQKRNEILLLWKCKGGRGGRVFEALAPGALSYKDMLRETEELFITRGLTGVYAFEKS